MMQLCFPFRRCNYGPYHIFGILASSLSQSLSPSSPIALICDAITDFYSNYLKRPRLGLEYFEWAEKSCVVGQDNNTPPLIILSGDFLWHILFSKICPFPAISSLILELVLIFLCSHCFHFSGGTLPVRVLTGRMMPAIWCKPVRADLICNHCSSCNHTDTAM